MQPNPSPKKTNQSGQIFAIVTALWLAATLFCGGISLWLIREFEIISGGNPMKNTKTWCIWGISFFAIAVVLPLVGNWLSGRMRFAPRYKAMFQSWTAASAFGFLLGFAWLAGYGNDQAVAFVQVLLLVLGTAVLWFSTRHLAIIHPSPQSQSNAGLAWAVLAWLPLMLLWLLNGAYGSLLDILLNGLVAVFLALAIGLICRNLLFSRLQASASFGRNLFTGGAVIGTTLSILIYVLTPYGNFAPLALLFGFLGWLAIGLSAIGQPENNFDWRVVALFLGLVAFDAFTLLDPDEMNLITNITGQSDVFTWVFPSASISLLLALVFAGVAFFLRARLSQMKNALPIWIASAVLFLLAVVLYFVAGQPGLYGEKLFVILKNQADLSNVAEISDPTARRQAVYQQLVTFAAQDQAEIRATLDKLPFEYQAFYLVNALEVPNNPFLRSWLASRPEVDRILASPNLRPLPNIPASVGGDLWKAESEPQYNLTLIDAVRVHEELGITGKGIVLGQSDSGVQWDHSELQDSFRGKDGDFNYDWFDPWYGTSVPFDIGGHGTHTTGTMLGNSVGVAPDAQFIACANLMRNLGNPADYLICMQFMLAPWQFGGDPLQDGKPELGANVLNNSWGCPSIEGCDPTALLPAVRALRAAGIFVVASAGNDGPACSSVKDPIAIYDESFSVGAVDEAGNVAQFSSRGPVTIDGSNRTKPDILAPGVGVFSSMPNNTFVRNSGTSMAGPNVAGVVALVWSANPRLIGDIDTTEQILIETATPYRGEVIDNCGTETAPSNLSGYGIVNAYAAVKRALELR